jgi:hypothetical protein
VGTFRTVTYEKAEGPALPPTGPCLNPALPLARGFLSMSARLGVVALIVGTIEIARAVHCGIGSVQRVPDLSS